MLMFTRPLLMALIPRLCRLARHPDVQALLPPAADMPPLALALLRHPEDAQPVLSSLTDLDEVTLRLLPAGADVPLMACCLHEGLAGWLHLCAQCTAVELLTALSQCAFDPDAATLSALVSRERQAQAQRVYGLQLLWRVLGDVRMPDAMGLFDPAHTAGREAFHG